MEGIDWRGWTAADQVSVAYLMLQRQHANDPTELRNLFILADDKQALAELDRTIMGQDRTIVTDR